MSKTPRSLADRFWEKVEVRGPDECWLWMAYLRPSGYGSMGTGHSPSCLAHRVSYELAKGPIPTGEGWHGTCVLHRCDNPRCVNPAHLFLGTHADNMRDASTKRRFPYGESSHSAKITAEVAQEIRASRLPQKELGQRYGISQSCVSLIKSGHIWRHV